jgi:hypothetical protein
MKKLLLSLAVIPLLGACVTHERERVVEQRPSTVVVPQGTTAAPGTTVVVPQSAPPPAGETTIIVPR